MTVSEIFDQARFLTNTNTTTASNTNLLRSINIWNKELVLKMSKLNEGWGEPDPTALTLVSGSTGVSLPSDCLKIKRAEVRWDADGDDWYRVRFFDLNDRNATYDTTSVDQDFAQETPYADVIGDKVNLYPTPDEGVSGGFMLWYWKRPTDFASINETPTMPEEYHRVLVDLVALDIKSLKGELSGSQREAEAEMIWKVLSNKAGLRVKQERYVKPLPINYD